MNVVAKLISEFRARNSAGGIDMCVDVKGLSRFPIKVSSDMAQTHDSPDEFVSRQNLPITILDCLLEHHELRSAESL